MGEGFAGVEDINVDRGAGGVGVGDVELGFEETHGVWMDGRFYMREVGGLHKVWICEGDMRVQVGGGENQGGGVAGLSFFR